MNYNYTDETLDCQDCGAILRVLSDAEASQVAANPYNYIVYCNSCLRDRRVDSRRSSLEMVIE
jgi:hypothetical protein